MAGCKAVSDLHPLTACHALQHLNIDVREPAASLCLCAASVQPLLAAPCLLLRMQTSRDACMASCPAAPSHFPACAALLHL